MRLALILALCSSGFAATVRVSCGGPGGVDAAGNVWQGDGPYSSGGATWAMPGQQFPYNNLRFSNPPGSPFSYSIPVNPPTTAGQYIVTLKLIEPNLTAIGKRRFSVSINGVQVVSNLDLFATVGLLKPYDLTFPVTASGVISVVLTPTTSADKAVISGIQIDTVDTPPVAAGATVSAQLADFMAIRTDAHTLTIGPLGNVAVVGIVYNFVGSVTATLSAGSGTLYLYIDSAGILTAGHNLTLACSGVCGSLPGIAAFPYGSLPLWSWTATNGTWDTSSAGGRGPVDYRAFLSSSSPPAIQVVWANPTAGTCQAGTVSSIDLKTPGASREVTVISSLAGDWRFDHVLMCEAKQFLGPPGVTYTASMGRPGSNDDELTGTGMPLGVAGGGNCWYSRPIPPQFSSTYSVVVNVASTGDVSQLTAGLLTWEMCGYSAIAAGAVLPKVAALETCSGGGLGSNCAGLYHAAIGLQDGTALSIVGPNMALPVAPLATWTPVK